jgi:ketosteroid isomerase-like protein
VPDSDVERLVSRFFDAWNRQDLAACLAAADPEVEYVNAPTAVEPGIRRGHEGFSLVLRKQWEGLGSTARVSIDRIEVEGDRAIVVATLSREMPGSDSRIEVHGAFRMTYRDERIFRVEQLGTAATLAAALESVGLS